MTHSYKSAVALLLASGIAANSHLNAERELENPADWTTFEANDWTHFPHYSRAMENNDASTFSPDRADYRWVIDNKHEREELINIGYGCIRAGNIFVFPQSRTPVVGNAGGDVAGTNSCHSFWNANYDETVVDACTADLSTPNAQGQPSGCCSMTDKSRDGCPVMYSADDTPIAGLYLSTEIPIDWALAATSQMSWDGIGVRDEEEQYCDI